MQDAKQLRPAITLWLREQGLPLNKAFRCLNPAHTDTNPSMRYNPRSHTVHCFACGATYDIFQLVGQQQGLDGFRQQLAAVAEKYGTASPLTVARPVRVEAEDFFSYRAGEGRPHPYFAARGLSEATVRRFGLVVEREWAVLPVFGPDGRCAGLCRRSIRPDAALRYKNSRGSLGLWNAAALAENRPLFVTEGIFDALSLIECGCNAVALCGAANIGKLEAALPDTLPALIAAGDGDEAGQTMNERLLAMAKQRGIPAVALALPAGCKDANAALLEQKPALSAACAAALHAVGEETAAEAPAEQETLADELLAYLRKRQARKPLSVGLDGVDALLGGGLGPGLCVLGAVSSMGKTSLLLQWADEFARQGREVLFLTIEMNRFELLAKSLARCSGGKFTAREILAGAVDEQELLGLLAVYRQQTGDRVEFCEPEEPLTPALLTRIVDEAVEKNGGTAPVIVLDYLQLMAPEHPAATDKQNTDRAVQALKQLAKRYDTQVLCVSSFNREAYTGSATLAAYKQSGLVEYSADLLLALQYEKAADPGFDPMQAASNDRRSLQLTVLKNRFGTAGESVPLQYTPAAERFAEKQPVAKTEKKARPMLR